MKKLTTMLNDSIDIEPVCYLKGTKILRLIDNVEQYINIENITSGTLIKNFGLKQI